MKVKLDLLLVVLLCLELDCGSADPDPLQVFRSGTVLVNCFLTHMEVWVKSDLFGLGMQVDPADLRLCVTSVSDLEFTFKFALTDCGTLSSNRRRPDLYNLLTYSPAPPLDGLVRLEKAVIPVECHYRRKFDLDSDPVLPTWIPHQTNKASLEKTLCKRVAGDWRGERGSTVFFLGDKVNVEAGLLPTPDESAGVYRELCVPLRPLINVQSPDTTSSITGQCLLDGRLTGSQSYFLPRERPDKLGLQLGAFLFPQVEMSQVYITCTLKAYPLDYVSNVVSLSWRSAEGDDWTCNSCEDRFQPTRSSPQKLDQVLPTYRPKPTPPRYLAHGPCSNPPCRRTPTKGNLFISAQERLAQDQPPKSCLAGNHPRTGC
uniref:Zona pellucida sperm-binding protein 3 n=1 Tax=Astyanax mexicanus TaxID=7994 RepID=A0A3B1K909_ASTMX